MHNETGEVSKIERVLRKRSCFYIAQRTNCPSETCATSSCVCTVSNKEEHTLHHLFKSLIGDVPGITTGWYALSLWLLWLLLPHLILHIAALFIVNLLNWFAKWTNKRMWGPAGGCSLFQGQHFLPGLTTLHYLDIITVTQLHPLFSSLLFMT